MLKGFYPSDRSYVPCAEKLKLTVSVPSEIPTEPILTAIKSTFMPTYSNGANTARCPNACFI